MKLRGQVVFRVRIVFNKYLCLCYDPLAEWSCIKIGHFCLWSYDYGGEKELLVGVMNR